MEDKVKNFLSKIASSFSDQDLDDKTLEELFNDVINTIPMKKKKLQNYLLEDKENKFKFFQAEYVHSKEQLSQEKPQTERNAFETGSFIESLLRNSNDCSKLVDIYDKAFSEKELAELSVTEVTKKLCSIAISVRSPLVVLATANAMYKFYDEQVENALNKTDVEKVKEISKNLFRASLVLRQKLVHHENMEEKNLPKPCHLISALFSLYVDLITSLGSQITDKNKLLIFAKSLLDNDPEMLLDALAQVSLPRTIAGFDLLEPIFTMILCEHNWRQSGINILNYLQLLYLYHQIRKVSSLVGVTFMRKYEKLVEGIPAPSSLYKWIVNKEGGEDVLKVIQITFDSSPQSITQYLMKDVESENFEALFNLCNVQDKSGFEPLDIKDPQSEDVNPSGSLFFVDTKPSKDSSDDIHSSEQNESEADKLGGYLFAVDTQPSTVDFNDVERTRKQEVEDQSSEKDDGLQETTHGNEKQQEMESDLESQTSPIVKVIDFNKTSTRKKRHKRKILPCIVEDSTDTEILVDRQSLVDLPRKQVKREKNVRSDSESSTASHGKG